MSKRWKKMMAWLRPHNAATPSHPRTFGCAGMDVLQDVVLKATGLELDIGTVTMLFHALPSELQVFARRYGMRDARVADEMFRWLHARAAMIPDLVRAMNDAIVPTAWMPDPAVSRASDVRR